MITANSGNAVIVGGNYNNGSNDGLSYVNNANSNANSNYGARLTISQKITMIPSAPECEKGKLSKSRSVRPDLFAVTED